VAGFFMRGRIGDMPVDFRGVILAVMLWIVAVAVTFFRLSDRYSTAKDPDPHFRAALYTAVWSVLYGLIGVAIVVLYDVLGFAS
jgi:tryptophan-rich sensory protein